MSLKPLKVKGAFSKEGHHYYEVRHLLHGLAKPEAAPAKPAAAKPAAAPAFAPTGLDVVVGARELGAWHATGILNTKGEGGRFVFGLLLSFFFLKTVCQTRESARALYFHKIRACYSPARRVLQRPPVALHGPRSASFDGEVHLERAAEAGAPQDVVERLIRLAPGTSTAVDFRTRITAC